MLLVIASDDSGRRPMPGPERAAIRQIAHAVLKSIKQNDGKMPAHAGMIAALPIMKVGPPA